MSSRQTNDNARATGDFYAAMQHSFGWSVPANFNMAQVCSQRWAAQPDAAQRTAIIEHHTGGAHRSYSYAQLQQAADDLSFRLHAMGVQKGDRVAIVLPQRFETAVAYIAVMQMGAVAMPLSLLFGPDALSYRLNDSEAVVALVDGASLEQVLQVKGECIALREVVRLDTLQIQYAGGRHVAHEGKASASDASNKKSKHSFIPVITQADDAAVLIYTSGTTGPPKGALIPHRALIGNLTGFVCSQNWFGFSPTVKVNSQQLPTSKFPSVFWSPADWAWTGGLMDALLPTLYFGRPIVAWRGRFSPELAFSLMQQHGVTHSFLFPTALKAMMKAFPEPRQNHRLRLQAIMSAGEAVGDTVFAYCQDKLGVTVNEMFGQTEINYIVGNCAMNGHSGAGVGWPARAGSMGRPYPGHRVDVINERGQVCAVGEVGDVALHRRDVHGREDPIFFLGYWRNPQATADKYTGDWCRTGDLATRDADGYLWYQGRSDDVFKAAGYRIGPSEIENCLLKHPAVANAAVVPKPDAQRGNVVKAYVVLSVGFAPSEDLVQELQHHVRGQLAPYEYPKDVEFIDALPMTTTGKVQRRVLRLQEEQRAGLRQA
jgi:acetyl-CoA synthetase